MRYHGRKLLSHLFRGQTGSHRLVDVSGRALSQQLVSELGDAKSRPNFKAEGGIYSRRGCDAEGRETYRTTS